MLQWEEAAKWDKSWLTLRSDSKGSCDIWFGSYVENRILAFDWVLSSMQPKESSLKNSFQPPLSLINHKLSYPRDSHLVRIGISFKCLSWGLSVSFMRSWPFVISSIDLTRSGGHFEIGSWLTSHVWYLRNSIQLNLLATKCGFRRKTV